MTNNSAIFDKDAFTLTHNVQLSVAVENRMKVFTFFKRTIDVVFSLIIVSTILIWLIPVLALLIKLDSRGPVFFKQKRTGYKGKTFNCFKLRTMKINKLADDLQASLNDPRITRMGKFLRVSNLDELPQFINVLIGEMFLL